MSKGQRFTELINEYFYGSQAKAAQELGVSRQTINRIVNGNQNLSIKILQIINEKFPKINTKYLQTGEGELLKKVEYQANEPVKKILMEENFTIYEIDNLQDLINLKNKQIELLSAEVKYYHNFLVKHGILNKDEL
jgi:DNA-binding XRE family transcriptional regulator